MNLQEAFLLLHQYSENTHKLNSKAAFRRCLKFSREQSASPDLLRVLRLLLRIFCVPQQFQMDLRLP